MNIGINTMELDECRKKDSVGSSRIRGTWLVKNWPEAELFKIGKRYDAVIFQKVYRPEWLELFEGIKIFDLCDPDWLDGKPVIETISKCDAVTTSTEALAEYLRTMVDKPVLCIPDRVEMTEHEQKKVHQGRAKSVVWFGYHTNQPTIDGALASLKRLGLKLTVVSDMPYYPQAQVQGIDDDWIKENVRNVAYSYETINDDLIRGGDILINPRIESGRFKFKSNNKSLTGWALGLPVAADSEDLERFMDEDARKKEAELRLAEVAKDWDVKLSVEAYKKLIEEIAAIKGMSV